MNLSLKDIGVVEFHEAFAGQVLANMTAMASEKVLYCIVLYYRLASLTSPSHFIRLSLCFSLRKKGSTASPSAHLI